LPRLTVRLPTPEANRTGSTPPAKPALPQTTHRTPHLQAPRTHPIDVSIGAGTDGLSEGH
jgi:hypothetical protein